MVSEIRIVERTHPTDYWNQTRNPIFNFNASGMNDTTGNCTLWTNVNTTWYKNESHKVTATNNSESTIIWTGSPMPENNSCVNYIIECIQSTKNTSVWDQLADTNSFISVYDKENKIIFIQSDITQGVQILKRSIFIKKMYDKGVAEFYFFAPHETFESSKEVFKNIVISFSTENVDQALPTEELKVAELEDDTEYSRTTMIALAAALLIIIAVIVRKMKLANRKKNS